MYILLFIISIPAFLYFLTGYLSQGKIFDQNSIENREYALVFGAGLNKNGSPSDILQDRLNVAVTLFHMHKVDSLFLSGSGVIGGRNESSVMVESVIKAGIPKNHIFIDKNGSSTLTSLINFSCDFPDSKVILLTQRFHLPRALILSELLEMDAVGCIANSRSFSRRKRTLWSLREIFALPYNLLKFVVYKVQNT